MDPAPSSSEADRCRSEPCNQATATWRGQCIDEFAQAEAIVSEALVILSGFAERAPAGLLPHLVGKRFEALATMVNASGPLASTGCRVAAALDEFKDLHPYRTFLCHGTVAIGVDHAGRWKLTLSLLAFRGSKVERSTMDMTEDQMASILSRLRSARVRLEGQMRGLLASLR